MFKVIIIIFFNLTIVFSQNINELFDNGNEFYSQNNYKEAISNYEKILENGYFSEDLYLNLGNAYFHESNGTVAWNSDQYLNSSYSIKGSTVIFSALQIAMHCLNLTFLPCLIIQYLTSQFLI